MSGLITLVLLMWKWVGLVLRKCWCWLSLLNWIGALTLSVLLISIAKSTSKNIGALIHSMKFLSPEVALYFYKSSIQPYMEYCCHVWVVAPSCNMELLDKLQKQICRTAGPSLAASFEPLAHCGNVASLSLFYRYYFGRYSSELAELVPFPYSRGRCTRYSVRLHDFYKDVYVNSFFPCAARLWNSLPIEWFPLTYDLSGFESRINRHLLTVCSFETDFLYALIFVCFFLLSPCLTVIVAIRNNCWIFTKDKIHKVIFYLQSLKINRKCKKCLKWWF